MHTAQPKARRKFYLVILAGIALGLGYVGYRVFKKFVLDNPLPQNISIVLRAPAEVIPRSTTVGLPIRLKVPKIKVDAAVDQVGLMADGELGAPEELANAAWYDQGPRPGDIGSAVIDGHFGAKDHSTVFDNLHTLQKGDIVSVEDENGAGITFVVRELRTYNPNADTASIFASNDGKAHLNLITCQGIWDNVQKSFSTRLVVFTDKVE